MELVINIPDRMWERVKEGYVPLGISKHLKKGTPLPKGHGRLIDADALGMKEKCYLKKDESISFFYVYSEDIIYAPTIIEADKESEVDE